MCSIPARNTYRSVEEKVRLRAVRCAQHETRARRESRRRERQQHNVCGRRVYAEGTADADAFVADQQNVIKNASRKRYIFKRLWNRLSGKTTKRIFDMIDILEAEKMK